MRGVSDEAKKARRIARAALAAVLSACVLYTAPKGGSGTDPAPNSASTQPGSFSGSSPSGAFGARPLPTGLTITALCFVSGRTGYIGGSGFIDRTDDQGGNWRRVYRGTLRIRQFDFLSSRTGFALATARGSGGNPGTSLLLQTDNGGWTWSEIPAFLPPQTARVHFIRRSLGYAAVESPVFSLWRTGNGGLSWSPVKLPAGAQTADFANQSRGWSVVADASGYTVEKTVNGGRSWTPQTEVPFAGVFSARLAAVSQSDVWLLVRGQPAMNQQSYALYRTNDGGTAWKPVAARFVQPPSPPPPAANGPGALAGTLDAVTGRFAALVGLDPAVYFGLVTVGATGSGGQWVNSRAAVEGQSGLLSFANPRDGWLAATPWQGPSTLYETTDGGKRWFQIYPSLSAQDAARQFRLAPLHYGAAALARVRAASGALTFLPLWPSLGVVSEPLLKALDKGPVLLLQYPHFFVEESALPISAAETSPARFDVRLANGSDAAVLTTFGVVGNQAEPNVSLYAQIGGVWIWIRNTTPGLNLTYLQLRSVADSMRAVP